MPIINYSDLYLSPEENQELQNKLDNISSPVEYIEAIQYVYRLVDIDYQINWDYMLDIHNNKIGFKGHFSGKFIPLSKKVKNLPYGFNIGVYELRGKSKRKHFPSTWSHHAKDIFRLSNGSGGGGSDHSYGYVFLDLDLFPKMKELYAEAGDYREMDFKNKTEILQKEYDSMLDVLDKDFLTLVDSHIYDSPKYTKIASLHEKVSALLKTVENTRHSIHTELKNEAKIKYAYEVPKPPSFVLRPTRYNECIRNLRVDSNTVKTTESPAKLIKMAKELEDEFAEYMI